MTETCCLDCVAACDHYNCNDGPPDWCGGGKRREECSGNCSGFRRGTDNRATKEAEKP
jgi:hypothetical protein